jgi:hypothetical protein
VDINPPPATKHKRKKIDSAAAAAAADVEALDRNLCELHQPKATQNFFPRL